jgi:hypothetical protein
MIGIVDPILFQGREEETTMNDFHNNNNTGRNKIQECLILILGIGIACFVQQQKNISFGFSYVC